MIFFPCGSVHTAQGIRSNLAAMDTYRAALVRAAELLGGASPLARRLQVPMPELTRWLAGDEVPSMDTFLKVVDMLLEDSRGLEPAPSRKCG